MDWCEADQGCDSHDVIACMDRMVDRGAIDTTRRVLQITKKAFTWTIGCGLITASPVAHVELRDRLPSVSGTLETYDPANITLP